MAYRERIKISQMTPKGANLELTDVFEVSTIESGNYVTKSITGEEILNATSGGTQTLQTVTDNGNTTTNQLIVSFEDPLDKSVISDQTIVTQSGTTNKYAQLGASGILELKAGSQPSQLKNTNVTNTGVVLEFPNKTTGSYTIATTSDIPDVSDFMSKTEYDPQDVGIVNTAHKEMVAVINKTGVTITKGSIVYLKSTSSSGTHPEILLADADTEATSSKTLGGVYEDILTDGVGYVVTSGEVDNLDTSIYSIGDKLWLSQTAGQVTTTPPTQPAHTVFIGTVTRSQNTNGRILYAIQNGYELNELHNVLITSATDGDTLRYNGTTSLWENYQDLMPMPTAHEVFRGVNYVNNSTTETTSGGITISTTGSVIARAVASNYYSYKQIRKGFYASVVSAGRYTGTRGSALLWFIGGGFRYVCEVYISDTAYGSGCRQFYGMMGQTSDLTYSDVTNVASMLNLIGVGSDASDTNLQVFHNDGSGTCTKVDLGSAFPANRSVSTILTTTYSIEIYNANGNITDVIYKVTNNETGDIATGTINTNLPLHTQGLNFTASRCMGTGITNTGQFDLTLLGVYSL